MPEVEFRRQISDYYGIHFDGDVFFGFDNTPQCDLAVATSWPSAYFVARNSHAKRKAYFVQDLESLFHPMGSEYLFAENSYTLGLTPITVGRWLAATLASRFGVEAHHFDFCADTSVYRPRGDIKPEADSILFVNQPEKPRRCATLGLEALALVKVLRPTTRIHLYGSSASHDVPFDHFDHGLLDVEQCNHLYNACSVGLCLSSSNPSRIPFEMMAAGLPVVDLERDNNRHDYPSEAVVLAPQQPERLAEALLALLDDPIRLGIMRQAGIDFMRERELAQGDAQFLAAIEAILGEREGGRPACPKTWGLNSPVLPRFDALNFACEDLLPFIRPAALLLAAGHKRAVVCGAGPAGRAAAHLLGRLGVEVAMFSDRKFHYFGGWLDGAPVVGLDAALSSDVRAFLIGSLVYWQQIRGEIGERCSAMGIVEPEIYLPDC